VHIVQHQSIRARVAERHALEANALGDAGGGGAVATATAAGRVVLQPRKASRGIEPEATEEPELARGGAHVGDQLHAGSNGERDSGHATIEAGRHEHDGAHVGAGEHRPRHPQPQRGAQPNERNRLVPTLPCGSALGGQPLASAGGAHFLAGGRRRGHRVQMASEASVGDHRFLDSALYRRPPGGDEERRQRERQQQQQRRMDGGEQERRDHQPEQPTERGEQRHEHVVEREDLLAQHRQPIEVLGPLVVLDGGHRRLQAGDVRLERDGHAIPEAALHALGEHRQVPDERRRHCEPDDGSDDRRPALLIDAIDDESEPQCQQRIGQHHQQPQAQRQHQQLRLRAIAQAERAPQRLKRRRQVGIDACDPVRATHAPPPLRPRRAR